MISFVRTPSKLTLARKTSDGKRATLSDYRTRGGGGGYSDMYAIWVCAAVKGMVFKQFSLG